MKIDAHQNFKALFQVGEQIYRNWYGDELDLYTIIKVTDKQLKVSPVNRGYEQTLRWDQLVAEWYFSQEGFYLEVIERLQVRIQQRLNDNAKDCGLIKKYQEVLEKNRGQVAQS